MANEQPVTIEGFGNMVHLKRLDFTKSSFVANGHTYIIEQGMSVDRYCDYQVMEKESSFGLDFLTMFNMLGEIRQALNEMRIVDASVRVDNLQRGMAKIDERRPIILKMCSLFINREDEDRTKFNVDMMNAKIDDWSKEYDVRDFFTLALNGIKGFIDVYNNYSQIITAQDKESRERNLNATSKIEKVKVKKQ